MISSQNILTYTQGSSFLLALIMNPLWIYRLRFIRRHLSMLLIILCAIILQSQLATAAHRCQLDLMGESVTAQHLQHQSAHQETMKTPLCEKHCLPDSSQQKVEHPPLVALPVSLTIAAVDAPCAQTSAVDGSLKPPAAGPPATIRFCRFRE